MKNVIASVDRLSRIETDGRRILSVYLSTDPSRGPGRNLRAQVKDLLQTVTAEADDDRDALEAQIARVHEALDRLEQPPRGLAIFAGGSTDLEEVLELPVSPTPQADWVRRVNLRPLLSLLDEYEPTLVMLVDKEHARLFRVVLDSIKEIETIEDDIPGRHSQGGEAQANRQRHHDELVAQHVRRAVEMLVRRFDEESGQRVALGGTSEVLAQLRKLLPRKVTDCVAGTIGVSVAAPVQAVLDAVREERDGWEREDETRLIAHIEEQIGRGRAVRGTQDVVQAIGGQRVKTLVYAAGTRVPGGRCRNCDIQFAAPEPARCPACGGDVEASDDLLDLLASRVLRNGGILEEVRGPAGEDLSRHGGIAALLLYTAPAERSA